MQGLQIVLNGLKEYKQKFYLNLLLKGFLISTSLLLMSYVAVNTLEYFGRFDTIIRAGLFYSFMILSLYCIVFWICLPVYYLLSANKQLSDEQAASQIGEFFPEINDKLLNTLQLNHLNVEDNALIAASIAQRTEELAIVRFHRAINYSENRRYLRYLLPLLILIFFIFLLAPQLFTESSARIINYNRKTPAPNAPFNFVLKNEKLEAFKNEDFKIELALQGKSIPTEVYITIGNKRLKMKKEANGDFVYNFQKIQKTTDFSFEAAGFDSGDYLINVKHRPSLLSFDMALTYPAYLSKSPEKLNNIGNIVVPEGTVITWQFSTAATNELNLLFNGKQKVEATKNGDAGFQFTYTAKANERYQINLKNQHAENLEDIFYNITIIPDQVPNISMQEYKDETTFSRLVVGGNISDDYGLSQLKLFYKIDKTGQNGGWQPVNIPIDRKQTIQNFYYELDLKQFKLDQGDQLSFYGQVWDNDGVNGAKSAKSTTFTLKVPDKESFKDKLEQSTAQTQGQMDKTIQKNQEIQKKMEAIENRLRNKNTLDFQDKKMIEEIRKKREELVNDIKKLQEQNQQLNEQKERFQESSPEIQKKLQQLSQLMNEILDEETKKLYEELQKLLEQSRNPDELLKMIDKLQQREQSLEKQLERALEMFKQLQFDQKLEETISDLKELAKEQEDLSEKTGEKKTEKNELLSEQAEIKQKFEEIKKDIDELKEMDKDLETPNDLEDTSEEEESIEQDQQNSMEQLQDNKDQKAQKSQKSAAQKMEEMSEKMEQQQEAGEEDELQENIDDLRAILENLVTLSFEQEGLMKDFRTVDLSDPRFKQLAQKQLKLKDDAKIVEDSLQALSMRVFEIRSFVMRELEEMKTSMEESTKSIQERKITVATGKQQFAMTSMNNLALLLSEVLESMQQSMASGQSKPGKKKKGKNGQSISKMQQQLNKQIEELKGSQKTGKELSEQLAILAAEQERIRRALKELEEKQAGQSGNEELSKQIQEIKKQMEETEKDLVNKNLNENTIKRQQGITTRLLEAEKAMREQEEDQERKGETAKPKEKAIPENLKQFFQSKDKQIELFKTVPASLSPYFKKEVDEYFKKINK